MTTYTTRSIGVFALCFLPTIFAYADVSGFVPLVPETPFITYGGATSFVTLVQALIGISVGIASILAVVMVAIGGFQYMTTDSVFALGNARERIKDAVVGLLIVLMSVLILRTINPNLVNLDPFTNMSPSARNP